MLPYFDRDVRQRGQHDPRLRLGGQGGGRRGPGVDRRRRSGPRPRRSSSPAGPRRATTWPSAAWPSGAGPGAATSSAWRPSIRRCSTRWRSSAGAGFEVTLLPVMQAPDPTQAGRILPEQVAEAIARRHDPRLRDAGQQRDRRDPAAGRDRPHLPRARRAAAHRRHAGRGQESRSTSSSSAWT